MPAQQECGYATNERSFMGHEEVPIKIDKSNTKTPTPTSGGALYTLGNVSDEYELWLEVPGPTDDELIQKTGDERQVKAGSHFYTVKKKLNPGNA
jgi:hypothetical protein